MKCECVRACVCARRLDKGMMDMCVIRSKRQEFLMKTGGEDVSAALSLSLSQCCV